MAEHPYYALALIVVGLAALIWSNRGHMPRPRWRLAALVLAMAATCGVVGYDLYDRHFGTAHQASAAPPAAEKIEVPTVAAGTFGWAPISTGNVDWDALDRACSVGQMPKLSVRADDGNVASLCDPNKKGWVAVCWHADPRMKRGIAPWPTKDNTPGLIGRCQGAEDWCAYKSPSILATEAGRRQLEKFTAPATVYACTALIKDEGAK